MKEYTCPTWGEPYAERPELGRTCFCDDCAQLLAQKWGEELTKLRLQMLVLRDDLSELRGEITCGNQGKQALIDYLDRARTLIGVVLKDP